jgi:hypothetical protein
VDVLTRFATFLVPSKFIYVRVHKHVRKFGRGAATIIARLDRDVACGNYWLFAPITLHGFKLLNASFAQVGQLAKDCMLYPMLKLNVLEMIYYREF